MASASDERQGAWIARPFPLWRGVWPEVQFVALSALVAGAFIYVTRPFGFSGLPDAFARTLILQLALACAAAALATRVALPFMLERVWDERRWTVGLQIASECVEVALVAVAIMLVLAAHDYIQPTPTMFLSFVGVTALCAILPMTIRTLLVERWLRTRHERAAAEVASEVSTRASGTVKIEGADGALTLDVASLRYVRAVENYVEIVWRDGETRRRLLRCTLADAERQLGMLRCHRSYLVAPAAVTKVSGNAQGYRLTLDRVSEQVPVSRSKAAEVLAALRA